MNEVRTSSRFFVGRLTFYLLLFMDAAVCAGLVLYETTKDKPEGYWLGAWVGRLVFMVSLPLLLAWVAKAVTRSRAVGQATFVILSLLLLSLSAIRTSRRVRERRAAAEVGAVMREAMVSTRAEVTRLRQEYEEACPISQLDEFLDVSSVKEPRDLQQRMGKLTSCQGLLAEYFSTVSGLPDRLEQKYASSEASQGALKDYVTTLREEFQHPEGISLWVQMTDQILGDTRAILQGLDASWGHWKWDTTESQIVFEDIKAQHSYEEGLKKVEEETHILQTSMSHQPTYL